MRHAFQEVRTAALLAKQMRALGFDVTGGVGKTGLVTMYRTVPGPMVVVRTDLDLQCTSRCRTHLSGDGAFRHNLRHRSWHCGLKKRRGM